MPNVDYDAVLSQLHDIGRQLKEKNDELRERCEELEERFTVPPFNYYNRFVNQLIIKNVRTLVGKARDALGL
jgi:hypothetical protein